MLRVKKLQGVIKRKYNVAIGERTAEDLKIKMDKALDSKMKISGRSYASGRRTSLALTLRELMRLIP